MQMNRKSGKTNHQQRKKAQSEPKQSKQLLNKGSSAIKLIYFQEV